MHKIQTYWQILQSVILIVAGSSVLVIAPRSEAGDEPENERSVLSLFVSEDEQKILDQPASAVEASLKPEREADASQRSSEAPMKTLAGVQAGGASYPHRYDGVVLRGKTVLGMWFDGKEFQSGAYSKNVTVSHAGQTGLVNVSLGEQNYRLYPGAELSPNSPLLDISNTDVCVTEEAALP